jgi:hypothetical protein
MDRCFYYVFLWERRHGTWNNFYIRNEDKINAAVGKVIRKLVRN